MLVSFLDVLFRVNLRVDESRNSFIHFINSLVADLESINSGYCQTSYKVSELTNL